MVLANSYSLSLFNSLIKHLTSFIVKASKNWETQKSVQTNNGDNKKDHKVEF